MEKSDLISAFFMAFAVFVVIVAFTRGGEIPDNENLFQGVLNTTQIREKTNEGYLRVYYSQTCPVCRKQIPELIRLANNGTFIELIDVYKHTELAILEEIEATPTILVIGKYGIIRKNGYFSADELLEELKRVRDKNYQPNDTYGR